MILVTGGAGFIGSNLQAALAARGHETVVVDWLGREGKWRNLAKHPPARIIPPDGARRLPRRPGRRWRWCSTSAPISADHGERRRPGLGDQCRAAARLWHWCAAREVRLVYASSAATYGDGAAGFDDDFTLPALERLRPLNLYGWTKHAFDLRVARALATRTRAAAAMGRAEVLQRLRAERIPQGADDLGGEGQARRGRRRRPGEAVPLRPCPACRTASRSATSSGSATWST